MTQQLEKTWAGKVFSPEELKDYASFEAGLKTRFTDDEHQAYAKVWDDMMHQISLNLDKDPQSEFGIALGKRCMDWVNNLYGKEHFTLRNSIWEKGFKQGKQIGDEVLASEVVTWLDRAIDAYYRGRIYGLLEQVKSESSQQQVSAWQELFEEMCGADHARQQDLLQAAYADAKISKVAKAWLKKNFDQA